ncbi:MAG: hypothetical protein IJN64_00995 [Lachnospiraceae bacterium]|nr:hypothetical protein [Lachnospiraceae bacterium]
MVRYTENTKSVNNGLVEMSEECQLAVNGGCSKNNIDWSDIIRLGPWGPIRL